MSDRCVDDRTDGGEMQKEKAGVYRARGMSQSQDRLPLSLSLSFLLLSLSHWDMSSPSHWLHWEGRQAWGVLFSSLLSPLWLGWEFFSPHTDYFSSFPSPFLSSCVLPLPLGPLPPLLPDLFPSSSSRSNCRHWHFQSYIHTGHFLPSGMVITIIFLHTQ